MTVVIGRDRCLRAPRLIAIATALLSVTLASGPALAVPAAYAATSPPAAAAGVAGHRPPSTAAAASAALQAAAPAARQAAPPVVRQAAPLPYEPHEQLAPLDAERAWQHSTGDGVVVAVLDSGVQADHPDLAGRVLPGRDYVDSSTDGRVDPVGHGTTVASLVAGAGDPALGLAPDATILPVRVLDEQNRYQQSSTVAEGVVWAVNHGADVINLSLGGPRGSQALADALAYAMANDVVVVACTGNLTGDDYQAVWYPAREPGVVAVAGIDFPDEEPSGWSASLTGPATVLAAPAVVTGAEAGGERRDVQGTSFSSALVAGAAALVRAQWPEMSAADVVNRLISTAHDLGSPGRDSDFGFGAVDPVAALTVPVPQVAANPLDTKSRHGASGFGAAPDLPWQRTDTAPPDSPHPETPGQPAGGDRTGSPPTAASELRTSGPWLLLGTAVAAAAPLAMLAALAALARRGHKRHPGASIME